ncbi:hypothetical protein P175DRAFT_0443530 [Aspergillus ochraceoroseus IBT 24754]|uniref:PHD-type domain-containing protein n=3 Tax=Aspergillus subgen. Nidulantes TaxID=2720870 RepID=A0A0F8U6K3_9EURO|nr:uncharacterized protein P175DRAFT_0443530 [Aspergillus ochraceoroseus IBT 24754]KKK15203.1 hypothetical protein ARAM_002020 [Aspergillus rambellii]KKK15423.1 hypothetical protein AOCH_001145 [Aspergillus ochraceoroseus]PTU17982.1 hypothetical protein P175DRAFT_0443530 [Aspergillus ochraceoroseus IBT 24754]
MLRPPQDHSLLPGARVSHSSSRERTSIGLFSQGLPSPARTYNGSFDLSDTEKNQIYNEWIASGKPHNLVCSVCRTPDDLMPCEACCRSYHTSCLPPPDTAVMAQQFYCPACKAKRWDLSPPKFGSTASSNVSRASTPSVLVPARVSSRSSSITPSTSVMIQSTTPQGMASPTIGSPVMERKHRTCPGPDMTSLDLIPRARQFMGEFDDHIDSKEPPMGLLLKLGSMLADLESQRQQIQSLRAENEHLRRDNANIKAYFDSNLSSGKPIVNSSTDISSTVQRPFPDTGGRSWDRIVMDLI